MVSSLTQILIVGAGPTGLALASCLQKAGVEHVLIDALADAQNTSRAAVIYAHTLETLRAIDVVDALEPQALRISYFTARDRGCTKAGVKSAAGSRARGVSF